MAAGTTLPELQFLINTFRNNGEIDGDEIQDIYQTIYNLLNANDTESLNLAWNIGTTYDTPATAATSGNPSYSESSERFWRSKTDNNTGNQPPTDSEVTENTHWIEVSASEVNPIKEWAPGIYGAGLIIVFYNNDLVKLESASRPYESTDIDAEILVGDWTPLIKNITGILSNLTTTDKTNLVAAINELNTKTTKFLGSFTSLANLQAAYPTASDGNYANVDIGPGNDVIRYVWDNDDNQWVQGGSSGGGDLLGSNNLSDLTNAITALNNLTLDIASSVTHSSDGVRAIDFATTRFFTLTLDANITTLTINNIPNSARYIPVVLRIEQNASTGYAINAVANLQNPDGVLPDYSTGANQNSEWYIYKTSTGIRIIGQANVS